MIEERDGVGTFLGRYVHGNDLILQSFGGSSKYFHGDGLGSTRSLSDSTGSISDRYTYEAFGNLLSHQGTTITPYLFAGERFDTTTENYYLRARWMRPEVGRFVGRDKAEFDPAYPFENNCYVALLNNPVIYIDPSGQAVLGENGLLHRISIAVRPSAKRIGQCIATILVDVALLIGSFTGDSNDTRVGAIDDEKRRAQQVIDCAMPKKFRKKRPWPVSRKRRHL